MIGDQTDPSLGISNWSVTGDIRNSLGLGIPDMVWERVNISDWSVIGYIRLVGMGLVISD